MENKIKNLTKQLKKEKGVLVVESAIVFPVMFFVLLFIIYIGNLFYEQARIDDIVMRYAVKGAQCVADPFLYDMEATSAVPHDVSALRLEPYRYILGGFADGSISQVEKKVSQEVRNEVNKSKIVFFKNMNARYTGTENDDTAYFNNWVIYSTFIVQVNYEVKIPIDFLGYEGLSLVKMSSRAEVPINDTDEFIRNIDMAVDLIKETKVGEAVTAAFDKVKSFIEKFANS